MKKIFLDANVIIDYLNSESKDHPEAKMCLQIIRTYYGTPIVSPFTFLITNYLAGKFVKDPKWHRSQMKILFSAFEITSFNASAINSIFASDFLDLEDGLQYECAISAKANVIITKNVHDFFSSKIPVIHPHDFVNRYKLIL